MATIKKNLFIKGASGKVADQFVYKKRGKKQHIALLPEIDENAVPTEKQSRMRDLFAAAAQYARNAMTDPVLKTAYDKKATGGATAFNMAFRDYLKAPKVTSIDTENYNGTAGSSIVVSPKDDFRVAAVKLSIHAADGSLVEQGDAVLQPVDRSKWTYTATQNNASLAGTVIRVRAFDVPGNKGVLEKTL